jgi:histidine triad (HIT) family protein
MDDCLFCKIADGRIPGTIVYKDANVVAFKDIHPTAPHHMLFIPVRHISSLAELSVADSELLGQLFAAMAQVAHELHLTDPDRGYRVVSNVGPDAGQSVQHLHFHLVGGRQLGWPPFPVGE